MKIACFGDNWGIPILCRNLPLDSDVIIVGAEIRPQYHDEIKVFADSLSIKFIIQPRKTSPEYPIFIERIKVHMPDFILVNSYSMLLYPDLLSIPKKGAINVHSALLPQYRGCNPIQWALLNDEKETGVTMHYMDADFDTGDIIAQKRVPILFEDTWLDIQDRIGTATEDLLSEEIPKLSNGINARVPQDNKESHYWRRRKPEDGYFEWTWHVRDIYNLIRALIKPHPGAYYYDAEGKKVVIDSFMPLDQVKKMQKNLLGYIIE